MSRTFLSLCSGIEAASVALEPLGWRPLAYAEIEPFPSAVLAHHYPHVPNLGDMTMIDPADVAAADALIAGTPCQGFSNAGLRGSLADARSNLCLYYVRFADAIDAIRRAAGKRPLTIVWENVPGVLSTPDNAFGCLLGGLAGHDGAIPAPARRKWPDAGVVAGPSRVVAWRVLDAQYFGVAQRRRRVFVLARGGAGGWACADALLPITQGVRRDPPARGAARQRTAESGAGTLGGRGTRSRTELDGNGGYVCGALTCHAKGDNAGRHDQLVVGTVSAKWAKGAGGPSGDEAYNLVVAAAPIPFAQNQREEVRVVDTAGALCAEHGSHQTTLLAGATSPIPFDTTHLTSPRNGSNPQAGDPCHPLAAGAHAPTIVYGLQSTSCGEGVREGLSVTLRANNPPEVVAAAVRTLTPRECERLQGFPDDWTVIPRQPKRVRTAIVQEMVAYFRRKHPDATEDELAAMAACPDSPRYKALGNSMAVPVIRWIGQRLDLIDAQGERHEP